MLCYINFVKLNTQLESVTWYQLSYGEVESFVLFKFMSTDMNISFLWLKIFLFLTNLVVITLN